MWRLSVLGSLLGWSGLLGCSGDGFLERPAHPDDVTHVVAVAIDAAGAVHGLSDMTNADAAAELRGDIDDSHSILVFGYAREDLERVGFDDAGDRSVRVAKDCELPLPTPRWKQRLEGPDDQVPPLTAAWMDGLCPTLLPEGAEGLVSICGQTHCGQGWTQDGCQIDLAVGTCEVNAPPSLTVRADGSLCAPSALACSTRPETAPAIASVECEAAFECKVDLFTPGEWDGPIVDRIKLADRPQGRPDRLPDLLTVWAMQSSWTPSLLERDGRVYVVVSQTFGGPGATDPVVTMVDAETLEVTATATVPEGVGHMIEDPHGNGFIASIRSTQAVGIARFDRDARLLGSTRFDMPPAASPGTPRYVVHSTALDRLVLYVQGAGEDRSTHIALFDPETLDLTDECRPPGLIMDAQGIDWNGRELVIADNESDRIVFLDPSDCASRDILGNFVGGASTGDLRLLPDSSDRVIVGTLGRTVANALHAAGPDAFGSTASFYESYGLPGVITGHPTDPRLMVVAVSTSRLFDEANSKLARFDPYELRFLPGSIDVGPGPVKSAIVRGRRIWLTLGYTAELVRVELP